MSPWSPRSLPRRSSPGRSSPSSTVAWSVMASDGSSDMFGVPSAFRISHSSPFIVGALAGGPGLPASPGEVRAGRRPSPGVPVAWVGPRPMPRGWPRRARRARRSPLCCPEPRPHGGRHADRQAIAQGRNRAAASREDAAARRRLGHRRDRRRPSVIALLGGHGRSRPRSSSRPPVCTWPVEGAHRARRAGWGGSTGWDLLRTGTARWPRTAGRGAAAARHRPTLGPPSPSLRYGAGPIERPSQEPLPTSPVRYGAIVAPRG